MSLSFPAGKGRLVKTEEVFGGEGYSQGAAAFLT
jgi:hypothetical protein